MNPKLKTAAKVASTFALIVLFILATPLLFAGDSPPFQDIPDYYFLKAMSIKLLGVVIWGICYGIIVAMWQKKTKPAGNMLTNSDGTVFTVLFLNIGGCRDARSCVRPVIPIVRPAHQLMVSLDKGKGTLWGRDL